MKQRGAIISILFLLGVVGVACTEGSATDIQFALKESYKVGERVEVKIRNTGKAVYVYNQEFAACDLSYFDASGRKFIIPPGTHCDRVVHVEINPGETKTLFEWDLDECIEDRFGCVKRQPLPEGTYTLKGQFDPSEEEGGTPTAGDTTATVSTFKIIR